jgi:pimeloyl-ACP methyl ester carboxylesterase
MQADLGDGVRADFSTPTPKTSGITPQGTAWRRYGHNGQASPVVLIHGVGMAKEVWTPQINDLAAGFDVVVYDMWGHGQSALLEGSPPLSQYAQQLRDLIDTLGLAQVQVVGHSMGALVALEFALECPARCTGVVAMNAVFMRSKEQRLLVRQRAAELLRHGTQANLDDTLKRWFGVGNLDTAQAEALSRKLLQEINHQGYAVAYEVFATSDEVHAPRLSQLQPRALFFTGELDLNSTPAMSHEMARLAPLGSAQVLMGHRHMMSLTAPQEVSLILREALNHSTDQML